MNVEHNDPRANMNGLKLDTVDILGVVSPPEGFTLNIYVGDRPDAHSDFTHNNPNK